jgi:hypothetical protein
MPHQPQNSAGSEAEAQARIDAKQRSSEMIRAFAHEGPQVITRPAVDLASVLLGGLRLDNSAADVLAEIEAERKADFGCAIDLEAGS